MILLVREEEYRVGDIILSLRFDMTKGSDDPYFVEEGKITYLGSGDLQYKSLSGETKEKVHASYLSRFYVDTKENRLNLKEMAESKNKTFTSKRGEILGIRPTPSPTPSRADESGRSNWTETPIGLAAENAYKKLADEAGKKQKYKDQNGNDPNFKW